MFLKTQGKNRIVDINKVREFVIDKYLPEGKSDYTYTVLAVYDNSETAVLVRKDTYADAQVALNDIFTLLGRWWDCYEL